MVDALRWFLLSPDGVFLVGVACFAFLLGVWWGVGYLVDRWVERSEAALQVEITKHRQRQLAAVRSISEWKGRAS